LGPDGILRRKLTGSIPWKLAERKIWRELIRELPFSGEKYRNTRGCFLFLSES